jgi:hypothetical protein
VYFHLTEHRISQTTQGPEFDYYDKFINAQNYEDIITDVNRLPPDSIIIGTRQFFTEYGLNNFETLKDTWRRNAGLTFTDIENMINQIDQLPPEQIRDLVYLSFRPDLWFLSPPAIPALSTGDLHPPFLLLNKSNNFMQSSFFQPFDVNYNYLTFTLDDFRNFGVYFPGIELPDTSQLVAILNVASKIIAVVSAVVMTVVSLGADTVPAWAIAVTTILTAVASGLNMASQYLEGGAVALPEGIAQAVAGLWGGIKGNLTGLADKLNIHFNNSALVFLNGIEEKMGVVIDRVEPYINAIRDSLADIGLNLQDNYQYLNTYLKGLIPNFPTLDASIARELQNYLVSNPALQGTNQAWMEAQLRTKDDIVSRIRQVDDNLISTTLLPNKNAITKLDILY